MEDSTTEPREAASTACILLLDSVKGYLWMPMSTTSSADSDAAGANQQGIQPESDMYSD
jgi:hypothetical protein